VLGQVRLAISKSKKFGASGVVLESLFKKAREVALEVKDNTNLSDGNVSVGRQAVEIFQNINPNCQSQKILIVGLGKMGRLVASVLYEKGFKNVFVTNRSKEKVKSILKKGIAVGSVPFIKYIKELDKYDSVFFCLAKVLNEKEVNVINELNNFPQIIDVGNPQNTLLLSSLNKEIKIYSIAAIKRFGKESYKKRVEQIKEAKNIVKKNVDQAEKTIELGLNSRKIGDNIMKSKSRINADLKNTAFLRAEFEFSFRNYFHENNYLEVHTPCIVSISTDPPRNNFEEELFSVRWYDGTMYLRQSNQMYKQMLALSGLEKIFEYGPFWREEMNPTSRHLSEAYGLDVEIHLQKNNKNLEKLISLVGDILNSSSLRLCEKGYIKELDVIEKDIPRIEYDKIFDLVVDKIDKNYQYGEDLGFDREYGLAEFLKKERKWEIFAIVNYPNLTKKFYTKETRDGHTMTFDVIYKGWEICSGAVRETNKNKILKRMKSSGVNYKNFQFYLDYFEKPVAHGGFCLGIDRVVAKLFSKEKVEDIVFFPRSQTQIIP